MRQLCKAETKSRACITVEKNAKLIDRALIKIEILTSRKVLYTRNQFLFCKKMLSKLRIFLTYDVSLSENKIDIACLSRFSKFQPTKEWVNKVNLSSFELKNFFKLVREIKSKTS